MWEASLATVSVIPDFTLVADLARTTDAQLTNHLRKHDPWCPFLLLLATVLLSFIWRVCVCVCGPLVIHFIYSIFTSDHLQDISCNLMNKV